MFTISDVVLEINPKSFQTLCTRLQDFASKEDPKTGAPSFVRVKQIDQLHFMSLQVFQDRHFDPLLILESNFDGDATKYWKKTLELLGQDLRAIFACTKSALDPRWIGLFQVDSAMSLDDFVIAHSLRPSATHVGALGMSFKRIDRDREVYEAVQEKLGVSAIQFRGSTPRKIQENLRAWAESEYSWLNMPEQWTFEAARASYRQSAIRQILPVVLIMFVSLAVTAFLCVSNWVTQLVHIAALAVILSLGLIVLVAAKVFLTAISKLEASDMTQADPMLDSTQLAAFASQEDQIVQNHVASMVLVKPGIARGIAIRISLKLLELAVPFFFADGYLGSMRTIHFAHWSLIGNSGRLLFLSNFDGSWQSYLDDFVDKASQGLTLAWGNCVGFPRTKRFIQQGAAHGTEFKAWARQSQTQNTFWYSAYKDLTVNQIVRNADIVDGIRKNEMTEAEAERWVGLL
jgi:hypothetical protein